MFHRGFEFASFAADARCEAVERLTPPFDLSVDVVVRDPEVPGGVGKPTMVLFQGAGDRVGIAERRSGGLMHRIDLLADLVDHPAEIRHTPAERLLGRVEVGARRFDQADQSLARTSRRPMRPVNPSSSSRLVLDSSARERLAPASSALRRPSLD